MKIKALLIYLLGLSSAFAFDPAIEGQKALNGNGVETPVITFNAVQYGPITGPFLYPRTQFIGVIVSGSTWSPEVGQGKWPGPIIKTAMIPAANKVNSTEQYRIYWTSDHAVTPYQGTVYMSWTAYTNLEDAVRAGPSAWTYYGIVWDDAMAPLVSSSQMAYQSEDATILYYTPNGARPWVMMLHTQTSINSQTVSVDGTSYNPPTDLWNQASYKLTSADGINWAVGTTGGGAASDWKILDMGPSGNIAGDRHSGYQHFMYGPNGRLMSWGLCGGTNAGFTGMWISSDNSPFTMQLDPRQIQLQDRTWTSGVNYYQRMDVQPFLWNGQWWQIMRQQTALSAGGQGEAQPSTIYACRLSNDMRRIVSAPIPLDDGTAQTVNYGAGQMFQEGPNSYYMVMGALNTTTNATELLLFKII